MIKKEQLVGRWHHSHEEDTDEETVFRPEGHAFPPSRGRAGLELRPDNTYVETNIGPDDRPTNVTGDWSISEAELQLKPDAPRSSPRRLIVTRAQPNRLAFKK